MFSRICFVLVLVAATNASQIKYRPVRQTNSPGFKWTMYNTPQTTGLPPNSIVTIPTVTKDPSTNGKDPLLVISLDNSTETTDGSKNPLGPIHIAPKWDFTCPKRFGYYRFEQSCDFYVECRNYRPYRKLCPDGMHFKESARWSEYPCGYPSEAPCLSRGGLQPARPSEQCPHQFGFYPITDKSWPIYERCNRYVVCSAGIATIMNCSLGLAFNPATGKCDWPERVAECRELLGFRCPVPALGEEDKVFNYRYVTDPECRYFFSCKNGRSRVLSCDQGLAFDDLTSKCIDEDLVHCVPTPYNGDGSSTLTPLDGGFTFGYHSVPLA